MNHVCFEDLTQQWTSLKNKYLTSGLAFVDFNKGYIPMGPETSTTATKYGKQLWKEFFSITETKNTGKCQTLTIPKEGDFKPSHLTFSCNMGCVLYIHNKNQRFYQVINYLK